MKTRAKGSKGKPATGKKREKEASFRIKPLTKGQRDYILNMLNNRIVFCTGPAGTGKTAVAIGLALEAVLAEKPAYQRIVVMRPAKEACGENLGFLPGSLNDKMAPWIQPVVDNMMPFVDQGLVQKMLGAKTLEVVPLAYARGRSFNESFIILDEAQNCSAAQMLMVLTRMGKGSKLVINGDTRQKDDMYNDGLEDAVKRLNGIEGICFVELHHRDIVRDPLVSKIIERYEV